MSDSSRVKFVFSLRNDEDKEILECNEILDYLEYQEDKTVP